MELDQGQKPLRIFGQEWERAKRSLANLVLIPGLLTYGSVNVPSDCPPPEGEVVWAPETDVSDDERTTRATTLNIASGRYGVGELVDGMQAQGSDIFGLQEVRYSVAKQLQDALGEDNYSLVFDQTLSIDDDPYGNAILTRYAVAESARYDLPTFGYQEPRSLLVAELLPDGLNEPPIVAAVSHTTPDTPGLFGRSSRWARRRQGEKIDEVLKVYAQKSDKIILMLDWNATDPESISSLRDSARLTPREEFVTHPFSQRGIDFVLHKASAGLRAESVALFDAGSDHCGVTTVFTRDPTARS